MHTLETRLTDRKARKRLVLGGVLALVVLGGLGAYLVLSLNSGSPFGPEAIGIDRSNATFVDTQFTFVQKGVQWEVEIEGVHETAYDGRGSAPEATCYLVFGTISAVSVSYGPIASWDVGSIPRVYLGGESEALLVDPGWREDHLCSSVEIGDDYSRIRRSYVEGSSTAFRHVGILPAGLSLTDVIVGDLESGEAVETSQAVWVPIESIDEVPAPRPAQHAPLDVELLSAAGTTLTWNQAANASRGIPAAQWDVELLGIHEFDSALGRCLRIYGSATVVEVSGHLLTAGSESVFGAGPVIGAVRDGQIATATDVHNCGLAEPPAPNYYDLRFSDAVAGATFGFYADVEIETGENLEALFLQPILQNTVFLSPDGSAGPPPGFDIVDRSTELRIERQPLNGASFEVERADTTWIIEVDELIELDVPQEFGEAGKCFALIGQVSVNESDEDEEDVDWVPWPFEALSSDLVVTPVLSGCDYQALEDAGRQELNLLNGTRYIGRSATFFEPIFVPAGVDLLAIIGHAADGPVLFAPDVSN